MVEAFAAQIWWPCGVLGWPGALKMCDISFSSYQSIHPRWIVDCHLRWLTSWEDRFASGVAPRQVFTSSKSPLKLSLVMMLTWTVVNVSAFATVASVFFTNQILYAYVGSIMHKYGIRFGVCIIYIVHCWKFVRKVLLSVLLSMLCGLG